MLDEIISVTPGVINRVMALLPQTYPQELADSFFMASGSNAGICQKIVMYPEDGSWKAKCLTICINVSWCA